MKPPRSCCTCISMASGCAVISSNRGGLPEACGGAAMLVDPEDYSSVVNCLHRLATDGRRLAEQKRWAVERAAEGTWTENAGAMEEVILQLFETKSARAECRLLAAS